MATYYVSAKGSGNGLSERTPMAMESALNRTWYNNDRCLFRRGDIFYKDEIGFQGTITDGNTLYVGSYGTGEKPVLSGAKIASVQSAWTLHSADVYRIDLSVASNFTGNTRTDTHGRNVGFIEDSNGNIYGNKRSSLEKISQEMDFYCDDQYLYVVCDQNPYTKYGNIILAINASILFSQSNYEIADLHIRHTGQHGIVNIFYFVNNVHIHDCIVEKIGGSYQYKDKSIRYGNGIEFYHNRKGSYARDILIERCIIRKVYDGALAFETETGDFYNIITKNNIFIENQTDYGAFNNGKEVRNNVLEHCFNLHINTGRGWSASVRPDKYWGAVFGQWGYSDGVKFGLNSHDNFYFNPSMIYWNWENWMSRKGFNADNNTIYLQSNAMLVRHKVERGSNDIIGVNNFSLMKFRFDIEKTTTVVTIANVSDYSDQIDISKTSNDYWKIWNTFFALVNPELLLTTPIESTIDKAGYITSSNKVPRIFLLGMCFLLFIFVIIIRRMEIAKKSIAKKSS